MTAAIGNDKTIHGSSGSGTMTVLRLCALTHTYLLFSIFPYAGYFALFLLNNDDYDGSSTPSDYGSNDSLQLVGSSNSNSSNSSTQLSVDTIGIYVGLIGSAFTFGRLVGFVPWKKVRAKYGERKSLMASLLLSALFSISFGMSQSFTSALLSRFAMGASNGISGSIKRAAIQQARLSKKAGGSHVEEEWALSRIFAIMNFGCASGPAVSGLLSYYDGGAFATYPYLAPNVFGAAMCVISAVSVALIVIHDDPKNNTTKDNSRNNNGESKSLLLGPMSKIIPQSKREKLAAVWKAKSTRSHLLAYTVFSFCITCVDEALPLFLIANVGGLGLSAPQAGLVLATSGFITALLEKTAIVKVLMEQIGLYSTLRLSSWANVTMTLLPLSLLLNKHIIGGSGMMTPSSFAFVVILSGVPRVFGFLYFSLIGVATCRTVPSSHADDAGHCMTLFALAARSVAPTVAGSIATFLSGRPWAIWISIGMVIGTAAMATTYALRDAADAAVAKGQREGLRSSKSELVGQRSSTYLTQRQRAEVYARMWEVHYDQGSRTTGAKWRHLARKAIVVNRLGRGLMGTSASGDGLSRGDRTLHRRVSWADRQLRPGIDVDEVPFIIIGTHKFDTACQPSVMTPPLMDAIQNHLPGVVHGFNYWLKYSLIRDGASLTALESKTGLSKYSILAIETLEGNVFGCFMTIPWERRSKYERCGQSFLWKMKSSRSLVGSILPDEKASMEEHANIEEDIEVFQWTGENDFCQLFDHGKIAVGGGATDADGGDGFGFVISDELQRGSSCPCATYNNTCLVSDTEGGQFTVANIEVWALTPFLFEADAERSERSIKHREQNVLQTPSSQSQWSQFL